MSLGSDLLSDSEDRAGSTEFQWSSTPPEQVLSLRILIYYTPPHQLSFLNLFITADFVTKMAEQTNFYAVQRGTPRSFKPVSDGIINLYLYTNIHTDKGRRPQTIFGWSVCKTHPFSELCFAHFHAKIHNINKRLIVR